MKAYYVGLILVVLMLGQAALLAFGPRAEWKTEALKYRRHQWFSLSIVAIIVVLFLGGIIVHFLDTFQEHRAPSNVDTAQLKSAVTNNPSQTNTIPNLTSNKTGTPAISNSNSGTNIAATEQRKPNSEDSSHDQRPPALPFGAVFTVFFLGIIRAIMDTDLPERDKLRAQNSTPKVDPQTTPQISEKNRRPKRLWDAFLVGLSLTLIVDLITDLFHAPEYLLGWFNHPVGSVAGFTAVVACAVAYLAWVYSLLVRQMTLVDNFSGSVVNRFLTSLWPEVPVQVVLIGPKKGGKSKIMSSVTGIPYKELKDTVTPRTGSFRGGIHTNGSARLERISGSVIDTPGENLGQHLAAAIHFRTDALALVLNSSVFDESFLNGNVETITIRQFAQSGVAARSIRIDGVNICENCKEYLEALDLATLGAETHRSGELGALTTIYKVHTFCLIIYNFAGTVFSQAAVKKLSRLAMLIGHRFGLKEERCHLVILDVTGRGADSPGADSAKARQEPSPPGVEGSGTPSFAPKATTDDDVKDTREEELQGSVNSQAFADRVAGSAIRN